MKKKKKKYFDELISKYADGTEPECRHFGKCGGCMFQNISYNNQLLLKKEYVNHLYDGILTVDKVEPSISYGYRNRMDYVCAFGKTGLRERGFYKFVVDVESCPLLQDNSSVLFETMRPLIKNVEGYDYLKHEGYLRYVILRQAKFTGETMVNFVVSEKENRLDNIIKSINERADSISILHNGGLADSNFGDIFMDIKKGYITEDFDGVKFMITPNSFFQSNSSVAADMYKKIKSEVSGIVLDLYCGVGSITLYCAEKAESILGVEISQEAVSTAEKNRDLNNIKNADFKCSDSYDFLKNINTKFTTLILDPPRSGLNHKIIKYIDEINPEKIVYMSCNPTLFKTEIKMFENYRIDEFSAFDMFPQTPHLETLAVMRKKQ
jgi:23S rRNA (uracil-5-)-methyltransferase RumA